MKTPLAKLLQENINHPSLPALAKKAFKLKSTENFGEQMQFLIEGELSYVDFEFDSEGFPLKSLHRNVGAKVPERAYRFHKNRIVSVRKLNGETHQDRATFGKGHPYTGCNQGTWDLVADLAQKLYALPKGAPCSSPSTPCTSQTDDWCEERLKALRERFVKCSELNRLKMIPMYESMWSHCQQVLDEEAKELDKLRGV